MNEAENWGADRALDWKKIDSSLADDYKSQAQQDESRQWECPFSYVAKITIFT